jgi:hypothetical protein
VAAPVEAVVLPEPIERRADELEPARRAEQLRAEDDPGQHGEQADQEPEDRHGLEYTRRATRTTAVMRARRDCGRAARHATIPAWSSTS